MEAVSHIARREPWNKGKIVGQKAPFKLKYIWTLSKRPVIPSGLAIACGEGV